MLKLPGVRERELTVFDLVVLEESPTANPARRVQRLIDGFQEELFVLVLDWVLSSCVVEPVVVVVHRP